MTLIQNNIEIVELAQNIEVVPSSLVGCNHKI